MIEKIEKEIPPMKHPVLIIEDDKEIAAMLTEFLTSRHFVPTAAMNGTEGLRLAQTGNFSCILLDLMLPYKSGDEVLRELRKTSNVPVIVLSAKGLTQNKIELLSLGADDYVTKPFDLEELLARILANIKRFRGTTAASETCLHAGPVSMDRAAKVVTFRDAPVDLTAKEYAILELLLQHPAKVFSKQNLYESVWGEPYAYDNDTINTHISNLRKKLDANLIKTIWSMGYKLNILEKL